MAAFGIALNQIRPKKLQFIFAGWFSVVLCIFSTFLMSFETSISSDEGPFNFFAPFTSFFQAALTMRIFDEVYCSNFWSSHWILYNLY
jgi:hypothetical protein